MSYPAGDHLQILNVIHGYTHAVDSKDDAALRAAFHPDAEVRAFGNVFSVDQYCEAIPTLVARMKTAHIIANEVVRIDGNRATASSYVYAMHTVPGNLDDPAAASIFGTPAIDTDSMIIGRYEDRLEKRDGEWRIAAKDIFLVWQQQSPTMEAFAAWTGR